MGYSRSNVDRLAYVYFLEHGNGHVTADFKAVVAYTGSHTLRGVFNPTTSPFHLATPLLTLTISVSMVTISAFNITTFVFNVVCCVLFVALCVFLHS